MIQGYIQGQRSMSRLIKQKYDYFGDEGHIQSQKVKIITVSFLTNTNNTSFLVRL